MIVSITLTPEDIAPLHDIVFETINEDVSAEYCQKLFSSLPMYIKGIAVEWGTNDTVFLDKVYEWIKENGDKLPPN